MRNWDGIASLLNVMDKLRLYPNLKALHDEAMADLEVMTQEKKPEPKPVPKPSIPIFEPTPKVEDDSTSRRL